MSVLSKKEHSLVLLLAAIQFTHILDFVIMMPLGPILIREFGINVTSFGLLVSSYTFSSAISGLLGALWIDKFERKKALMICYSGFALGTLLCFFSWGFESLMAARIFAGAFGGLVNTLVFTIVGDTIPEERRGRATGIVMAAFSVSSVLGVPIGLSLAEFAGWNFPFLLLALVAIGVLALLSKNVPTLNSHLSVSPVKLSIPKQLQELLGVARDSNHLRAYALTVFLMFAAFTLIPFISPYLVSNVGLKESHLALTYFCGGLLTFFTSRWIGRLADKFGKFRMFWIVAMLSLLPILTLTHLRQVPLFQALIVTTFFMSLVSGRFVPAMALITSAANPKQRGRFMALNNAIHHSAAGAASLLGGLVVTSHTDGMIQGYDKAGYIAVTSTILCIILAKRIRIREPENQAAVGRS